MRHEGRRLYLAVGAGGHRMFSTDGVTWENHAAWGEPKHDQTTRRRRRVLQRDGVCRRRLFQRPADRHARWQDLERRRSAEKLPRFRTEVLDDALYAITLPRAGLQASNGETWTVVGKAEMPSPTHWIRNTVTGNGIIVGSGDFGPVWRSIRRPNGSPSLRWRARRTRTPATNARILATAGLSSVDRTDCSPCRRTA